MSYLIYKNLAELNALDAPLAISSFERCCGSTRWAEGMADARPFATVDDLMCRGEESWFSLPSVDQLEAYGRSTELSDFMSDADVEVRDQLGAVADLYQEKFGFRLVINVHSRPPDEVLAIAEARLRNSAETELKLASEEQGRIIQIRLAELLER